MRIQKNGGVQPAFPRAEGSGRPNWVGIVMDCTGRAFRPQWWLRVPAAQCALCCAGAG